MKINIRKANMNDLIHIQNLNNSLFDLEYNNYDSTLKLGWPFEKDGEEYFIDKIKNTLVFVAEINGKIVGYLAGSILEEISYSVETFAELDNMCIDTNYRGYGIGSKLIDEFKNYCKNIGIENIKVTAYTQNKQAINFYMKNGFHDYNTTLIFKI